MAMPGMPAMDMPAIDCVAAALIVVISSPQTSRDDGVPALRRAFPGELEHLGDSIPVLSIGCRCTAWGGAHSSPVQGSTSSTICRASISRRIRQA
jgi:hypothetical protein